MYGCAGCALLKGTQLWMSGAVIQSSPNLPRLVVALPVDPHEPQLTDSPWLWYLFLANSNPIHLWPRPLFCQTWRPRGTHHKSLNIAQVHQPPHVPDPNLLLLPCFSFGPFLVHFIVLHEVSSGLVLCQNPGVWWWATLPGSSQSPPHGQGQGPGQTSPRGITLDVPC